MEVVESESDKWILDGWSLDLYGSKEKFGLGVAKDIYSNDWIEIDAGIYAVRSMVDFFKAGEPTDIRVGFSGSWSF